MKCISKLFSLWVVIIGCLCLTPLTFAKKVMALPYPSDRQAVVTLFSGPGRLSTKNLQNQTAYGTDENIFTYQTNNSGNSREFVGLFLGGTRQLSNNYTLQLGLEYDYSGSLTASGINTTGDEPATLTSYSYQYKLKTQQIMAVAKLFTSLHSFRINHDVKPYVSVGLGTSFNRFSQFSATTDQSGSVNLTPSFANKTTNTFSYSLGVGAETKAYKHVHVGIGYRFMDLGPASSGRGQIAINNFAYPVNFRLQLPKLYANQLLLHVTYLA